jgi:hypothetical protein
LRRQPQYFTMTVGHYFTFGIAEHFTSNEKIAVRSEVRSCVLTKSGKRDIIFSPNYERGT